jgi:hypothetical protein
VISDLNQIFSSITFTVSDFLALSGLLYRAVENKIFTVSQTVQKFCYRTVDLFWAILIFNGCAAPWGNVANVRDESIFIDHSLIIGH